MVTATVISIVQKFASLLQLLGEFHGIWSVEIVFGGEYDCWWEFGNLCHGGFTWENVNAVQSVCGTVVSAGSHCKLHEILDFVIGELERWSPFLGVERVLLVGPHEIVDAWQ